MNALSTAWTHIRRSPYQAIAAIFIMMQTFFVLSAFTFLLIGSFIVIRYYESLPQLRAFFTDEAKIEEIQVLEKELQASGKVRNIVYVDKEKAFKRYKELFKDDPLMLEFVTPDILPASFEIATNTLMDQEAIAKKLKGSSIVSEVDFPKEAVEGFARVTNVLRQVGAVASVILAVDAVFLIMLIISMKISRKRKEIEVLKLLSATNWYIRWPFIYEGVFYGVIGAILGWGFASGGLIYLEPFIKSQLPPGIPLFPISPLFFFWLLGMEILVAVLLGTFSSILAAIRYLKQ